MMDSPKLTVILPCRDEEQALGKCLGEIKTIFTENNIDGEIIVSDSSSDRSPAIAKQFGARLVKHDQTGYGAAYLAAFAEARGQYLFLADADGTYDFREILDFLKGLDDGYDLVIGNRLAGRLKKGAMPFLHQYLGSPFLSFIFRLFFSTKIKDINCGMRAIRKSALNKLNLKSRGMEFASEMLIEAVEKKLPIKELPIDYHPRLGQSKLRPIRDGFKHLGLILRRGIKQILPLPRGG